MQTTVAMIVVWIVRPSARRACSEKRCVAKARGLVDNGSAIKGRRMYRGSRSERSSKDRRGPVLPALDLREKAMLLQDRLAFVRDHHRNEIFRQRKFGGARHDADRIIRDRVQFIRNLD